MSDRNASTTTPASTDARLHIDGIREAREVIAPLLTLPTPLIEHPLLSEELGVRVLVKHENHLPTGAFKVRGGLHFMHHFARERTHAGVATATRGNHGQSLAYAARAYGVPCTIVVPFGNNPEKNAAMKAFGARLIEHGRDFDEARVEAERLCREEKLRFVHPANEPWLIHGVGTYALEVIEACPDLDVIIVPIGLGSGITGTITAVRALAPKTKVIGVQAANASAIHQSWKTGAIVETATADTIADGLATRCPAAMTFDVIRREVDDILTASEDELAEAIRLAWRTTHNMLEPAAAASIAAARKLAADTAYAQKTIVAVATGANIDTTTLRRVFAGA